MSHITQTLDRVSGAMGCLMVQVLEQVIMTDISITRSEVSEQRKQECVTNVIARFNGIY